jgi:hypothetical protein
VPRRVLTVLLLLAVAGCGGEENEKALFTPTPAAVDDKPCPPGTPQLGVRDILPELPAGMTLLRVDKASLEKARNGFAAFGDKLRSVRWNVVAQAGRRLGVDVFVLNLDVDMRDEPPPEASPTRKPMTIAGRPGQIMVAPADTGARASGSVGDCGTLVLRGPDEAAVRRVAAMIRQPD